MVKNLQTCKSHPHGIPHRDRCRGGRTVPWAPWPVLRHHCSCSCPQAGASAWATMHPASREPVTELQAGQRGPDWKYMQEPHELPLKVTEEQRDCATDEQFFLPFLGETVPLIWTLVFLSDVPEGAPVGGNQPGRFKAAELTKNKLI